MLGCRWAARIKNFGGLSRSSFLVLPLFVLVGSVGIASFTLRLPPDTEGKNPHPLKFTRATPKQHDRGYLRLPHPVTGVTPTPTELLTDRNRCWTKNLRAIWGVRGIRVPGNGNRNGRRAVEAVDHDVERRGGEYRPLGGSESRRPLHADAEKAWAEHMSINTLNTLNTPNT